MTLPALIFDLDGTLVDTAPDLLAALNAVLSKDGRAPVDPQTLRHMVGFGARSLIEQATAATGKPVSPERLPQLVDTYIAHYRDRIARESRPFPGVVETLAALKRDGARMGVLTNKPQELAVMLLKALGLTEYFEAVCGAGRYSYSKPDPRVLRHIVDELGGAGQSAVMIGDSATDVATARAGGIPVVLVSYGYTPEPASHLRADAVIDSFAEIPAFLSRLVPHRSN